MKNITAVLFDLDGTVIDSYPGIQAAFDKAYKEVYGLANEVSIRPLIGPPIQEILVRLNRESNPDVITTFVTCFKDYYDREEFKRSELYGGIEDLFVELKNKEIQLFIATNKRQKPTQLILSYLSLNKYFSGMYSSDSTSPDYSSKSEMVERILKDNHLSSASTLLIGDTYQDEIAAKHNNIDFIYAAYGYGNLNNIERIINKPLDTLNHL